MVTKHLSPSKRGVQYEKRQATKTKSKHLGGSGKPDLQKGKIKIEVKNWATPVHSGIVKDASEKKVTTIISKSGFTKPAIELAKKKSINLKKGR